MRKRISGILLLGILCSMVSINFFPSSKVSAAGLPQCLTDKSGLTEFNAVSSNHELVARLIYAEAYSESMNGKKGVAQVVVNRALKNLAEFGGNQVRNVVLKQPGGFVGMTTSLARCPQNLTVWNDSYNAAADPGSATVKVGSSLWFNTNTVFAQRDGFDGSGYLTYTFPGQSPKRVTEKVVIGNHTFFRIAGY